MPKKSKSKSAKKSKTTQKAVERGTRVAFVINPAARKGAAVREWHRETEEGQVLDDLFGKNCWKLFHTEYPDHAATLIPEVVRSYSPTSLVSIGGDGTHSEIVNGIMNCSHSERGVVRVGFIHMGTGGDFARVLLIREMRVSDQLAIIAGGLVLRSDVGRVEYYQHDKKISRHFINIAAAGIGGEVCHTVNHSWYKKWLGGTGTFFLGTLTTTFSYSDQPALLRMYGDREADAPDSELRPLEEEDLDAHQARRSLDGRNLKSNLGHDQPELTQGEWQLANLHNLYCAKGQYQGGGMWITPRSSLQSGYFEVAVMHDTGVMKSLTSLRNNIYLGTLAENCSDVFKVFHRVRRVKLLPLNDSHMRLEVDGETPELDVLVSAECKAADDARLAAWNELF